MLGASGARMHSKTFFAALAFATAAPLVALPLYAMTPAVTPGALTAIVVVLWTLTGNGHVLSTLWFAADPDYASVVRAHRWRMVASLAIIPVTVGVIAVVDARAYAWIYAGFLVWQAHHYNRQNYGILSFAAVNDRLGPLPRDVGLIINLTTAAGALGMVTQPTIYPRGLPVLPFQAAPLVQDGRWVAIACFIAAVGLIARLLWKNERLRQSPTVLVFLGLSVVFFLPSLLPGAPQAAFWPYAMAHGAQYLVIMGVTSRRAHHSWPRIAAVAGVATVVGAAAFKLSPIVLAQAYMGVVVWHFLADARLWRLRDTAVRTIVRSRFDFLFASRPAPDKSKSRGREAAVRV